MADIDVASFKVQYRQILDETGQLVGTSPELSSDHLKDLFRQMLLIRKLDQKMVNFQRQGRMGTYAPVEGQEACQVGTAVHLKAEDWAFPAFREQGVFLTRGMPLRAVLLYFMGSEEANRTSEDNRTFPISVAVASQMPIAVGCAMAMKFKKEKSVVAVYFSDGATSEGDFAEALNFASVYQTPNIFFCQNNQWAISVPRKQQTAAKTLAQKALAYDMKTLQVDGNDILAVYQASEEAITRARKGDGPSFLELVTYRRQMHTTADDPKKYRNEAEHQKWMKRDPLTRFETYLKGRGIIDDKFSAEIHEEAEALIKTEFEAAKKIVAALKPEEIFKYTYETMPKYLVAQYEELMTQMKDVGA